MAAQKRQRHAAHQEYIQRQIDQFMSQLSSLLEQYEGHYVAFEDGRVLDEDMKYEQLALRIYGTRASQPPLIRLVERQEYIARI